MKTFAASLVLAAMTLPLSFAAQTEKTQTAPPASDSQTTTAPSAGKKHVKHHTGHHKRHSKSQTSGTTTGTTSGTTAKP